MEIQDFAGEAVIILGLLAAWWQATTQSRQREAREQEKRDDLIRWRTQVDCSLESIRKSIASLEGSE